MHLTRHLRKRQDDELRKFKRISLFDFQGLLTLEKEAGGVAQLGEHLPCKQGVKSSNLFISTRK